MAKRLLLLFTTKGYQASSFKEAAEKLGVALVAGSDRCHVLDDPWRDGAIPLRFEHPEQSAALITEAAQLQPFDSLLAIGDKPVLTAALASESLRLPGNAAESVRACRDKFSFRERLKAAGAPGPAYRRLKRHTTSPMCPETICFPCVLKPTCLSASRGVIRADDPQQFSAAFERIRTLLDSPEIRMLQEEAADWILVEEYLPGEEVALEGLLTAGKLQTLAIFDKPDPLEGPYFEETIYVTPSRLPESKQAAIVRATEEAIAALGLCHGPIHAEIRLTPAGPRVLEIAARPIGGLCSRALRFQNGISLEELLIRHALGEPMCNVQRESAASGVMMIPVPSAGVLNEVRYIEEALATPHVKEIRITAKLGQALIPWPEGSSYLGFIFARANSAAEVECGLRQAHQKIEFVISPALPVLK